MEKQMKIAKNAKMSKAEIEEFESDLSDFFEEGLKDGSTIISKGSWEDTIKAIKERKKREKTKMKSYRIPTWIIEGIDRKAAKNGIKPSEFVIETLAKAAV